MIKEKSAFDETLGSIIQEVTRRLELEEKLRVLSSAVEQVSEGITISNLDGKLVYANPAFADMHGYEPSKLIGESILNFYSSEEQSFVNTTASSCSGEQPDPTSIALNGEFWHVKNDGTKFPTLTKNSVLCDESGKPIGLIGTHADITKLKRSEIELRKLGVAVEQSIDGVAVTDLEMRLTYVNDAFATIHGYTSKEMIGMRLEELHNKIQLKTLKIKMDYLEKYNVWEGEIKRIRKDNSQFPSYMSLTLIKDPYGKPMGTLTITRDISERKRMEAKLKRYTKHLKEEVHQRTNELIQSEKMASLGQLVDGVAHELNNPLEYVTLNTELIQERLEDLKENYEDNEIQVIVNEIYSILQTNLKGVDRIASIAKTLTRFAEPEKTGKHLLDVNQGLKDTLRFFYNQNRHRITIHENYDKIPEIKGNLGQLNQVFMSLFLNSSQAMDQGDIWVRTKNQNRTIYIEIEDNGSGIPKNVMDNIFDPFFSTRKGATGLGLSLAYRIIKAHNGEININSKTKKGTKVRIKLPLVETYEN
jgi:PAS domain S-box-containing protein